MDDFFVRALLAGTGIAVIAGPLGCFLVWRRQAFFGAALAHSALLGVALGLLLGINLTLGVFVMCLVLAVVLVALERQRFLAGDTLLSIMAHGTLAIGLILVAAIDGLRLDLLSYLFGDVLAVSTTDIVIICGLALLVILVLGSIWNALLSATVNEDLAAVEGVNVTRVRLIFTLLIAATIAVGMKIAGMLLIISLLIIPAAAARKLSDTPERMVVIAVVIGALSAVSGLFASLYWDVPAGSAIVAAAVTCFAVTMAAPGARGKA